MWGIPGAILSMPMSAITKIIFCESCFSLWLHLATFLEG